jgi:uncharacterized Tic20 family protein
MAAKAKTSKKAARKPSNEDAVLAMLAHLLGLFTGFVGPLVIFLIKKDDTKSLVYKNARHALNFQISLIIYSVLSGLLVLVIIGIPLIVALSIFALVVQIVASIRAYEGNVYKYPLEIEFIK